VPFGKFLVILYIGLIDEFSPKIINQYRKYQNMAVTWVCPAKEKQ
jgi:hypothetical protein